MYKFFNFCYAVALILWAAAKFVWQLPQTIVGVLLVALYYEPTHILVAHTGARVVYTRRLKPGAGFSLGFISVLSLNDYRHAAKDALERKTARHEWRGHGMQSLWLGPLYLFVVALPSLIHAAVHDSLMDCMGKPYGHYWTENWADRITDKYACHDVD